MVAADEHRWRVLAEAAFEGVALVDGGRIADCNDSLTAILRLPRARLLGRSVLDFVCEDDAPTVAAAIREGRLDAFEVQARRADGEVFPARLRGRPLEVDGRTYRVSVVQDLSEQRRSESRYRHVFDAVGDGLMLMDRTGRPLAVNRRLCEMLGYEREALLRLRPEEAIADLDTRPMQLERLARERAYLVERRLRHRDGHLVPVEVSLAAISREEIVAVVRDIRERRRLLEEEAALRERLHQARKMESLGRLAGGIAHDFNNLLTVILGNVRILEDEADAQPLLEEIREAAERAADLTDRLLRFGQSRPEAPRVLDPNTQVRQAARLLERLIGEAHSLTLDLSPEAPPIRADPGALDQILVNLVVNARDAMPGGGAVGVETRRAERGGRPALELSVWDTGEGVDRSLRERIFEPFFTTKPLGRGTGLGLSNVFSAVTAAGGEIAVLDGPQGGARFRILWPAVDEVPRGEGRPRARAVAAPGGLRVLLVEDDRAVRAALTRMLKALGHQVEAYPGGQAALDAAADRIDDFDVVLTDVVMPGMSGPEFAEALGRSNVVFMSGYAGDALKARGLSHAPDRFLQKPFEPEALEQALHRAAGSRPRRS